MIKLFSKCIDFNTFFRATHIFIANCAIYLKKKKKNAELVINKAGRQIKLAIQK